MGKKLIKEYVVLRKGKLYVKQLKISIKYECNVIAYNDCIARNG